MQTAVVDIPLLGGLDTKPPPALVQPGRLIQAQNCVMRKRGRIEKRNGFALIRHPLQSALGWTDALGSELLVGGPVAGEWKQHGWSKGSGAWVEKGSEQPVAMSTTVAVGKPSDCKSADLALGAGFGCYVYENGTEIRYTIVDEASGQPVAYDADLVTGTDPRVVAIGPYFCVVFTSGAQLQAMVIDPIQNSASSPVNLSGSDVATGFDARAVSGSTVGHGGEYVAVAYSPAYGGPKLLGFDPWAQTICVPASQVGGQEVATKTVSLCVFASQVGVAFLTRLTRDGGAGIWVAWASLSLAISGSKNADTSASAFFKASLAANGSGWTLLYDEVAAPIASGTWQGAFESSPSIKIVGSATVGGAPGQAAWLARNASLAGDAFASNGILFAPAAYRGTVLSGALPTTLQETYFVLNAATGQPVARFSQLTGGGPPARARCPQVSVDASGRHVWACGIQAQSSQGYGGAFELVRSVARATADFSAIPRSCALGGELHMAGGFLSVYDGDAFVEHGFHLAPEPPVVDYCNIACIRTNLGKSGTAEVDDVYFPPDLPSADGSKFGSGWQVKPGSYVTLPSQSTASGGPLGYVWFSVDGVGADPAQWASANRSQCALLSTDNAQSVATKFWQAVSNSGWAPGVVQAAAPQQGTPPTNLSGFQTWFVSLTCVSSAGPPMPATYSEDFRVDCFIANGSTGVTGSWVACPGGSRIMPGGYFVIPVGSTPSPTCYVVWFSVSYDGGNTFLGSKPAVPVMPPFSGANPPIASYIEVQVRSYETPKQIAADIYNAINGNVGSTVTTLAGSFDSVLSISPTVVAIGTSSAAYVPYCVNAGGVLQDGYYLSAATWEWTDGKGLLHRSAPSLKVPLAVQGACPTIDPSGVLYSASGSALSQAVGVGGMTLWGSPVGGSSPFFVVPSLYATEKSAIALALYRSTAGSDVLYRITDPASPALCPAPPAGVYPYQPSTGVRPLSGTTGCPDVLVAFDTLSDAELRANATLYTTGGVLSCDPVPSCSFLHAHRGRLWAVPTEYPNQLWYSQPFSPQAQIGVAFSGNLYIDIPENAGPVIGLASLDDKLVVLCSERILYIAGDGPTATGDGEFAPPQPVPTDVGCVAAGSILESFDGLWFQSAKGIYFCDRALNVAYRGQPWEALVLGMTCTCAQLIKGSTDTEIRFFMAAKDGSATQVSDYCLTYNYATDFYAQNTKWAANAATVWSGGAVFVDGAANVCQETPGVYLDDGAPIQLLVQTAWLGKQAGVQGYLRIPRVAFVGDFQGGASHKVLVQVGYDYEAPSAQVTWDPSLILAASPGQSDGTKWQFRMITPRGPRGAMIQALSLIISDYDDAAPWGGFAIDMVTAEVGMYGKLARLGQIRTTG